MKIVDSKGTPVTNLDELEPWCHFLEGQDGTRHPILSITYSAGNPPENKRPFIKIEWNFDVTR